MPLYVQLRGAILGWIRAHRPGDRLPAERELAAMAGVDRATVRKALVELVRAGYLRRRAGRGQGTVIVRLPGIRGPEASGNLEEAHPFTEHAGMSLPFRQRVRLALFEYLPAQKACWSRLVEQFNRRQRGVDLEAVWLPADVSTDGQYAQFIAAHGVDLFSVNRQQVGSLGALGVIRPLSPPLTALFRQGDFLTTAIDFPAEVTERAAPLHIGVPGLVWNCEYDWPPCPATQADCPAAELWDWVRRGPRTLPADVPALSTPWQLAMMQGLPHGFPAAGDLEAFLRTRFTFVRSCCGVENPGFWNCQRRPDITMRFITGRAAGHIESLFYLVNFLHRARFNWQTVFIPTAPGLVTPVGMTGLAIHARTPQPTACEEVIRFLLSAEAQDLIAAGIRNVAVRRESNRLLLDCLHAVSEENFRQTLVGCRLHDPGLESGTKMLMQVLADLFQGVAAGVLDPQAAVALAMQRPEVTRSIGLPPVLAAVEPRIEEGEEHAA